MRTRTTPRTVRLLSTVVAAGVAGTLAWTPSAQAADAKPLDVGPGYTIPDSDGNAATSHIGAYGPPGIKVWGDSETYCADPERKGPQAAGGYTGPKTVTHWTSSETGQAVPDSHVAYASYVIGKYGQTQSNEQAAAVDAATYEFLAGGTYAINGSRGKQRLGYPNVSPTARTLAEGYIAEAKKYAGPYTLHIKPSVETTTAGKKVSVAVEVTASLSGAKVPGVKIDLFETGSGTARGSVTTGKDGTASWQFTTGTAGEATVKATASGLPGSQLKVLEPRDASAQRMLLAGDTTAAEGTTKVKVTPATGGVEIHKTDPGKDTMAGAGFQLIDPVTGKTVAEGKTNADGILAFENLAPGTYRLHETDSGDKIHALVPDQDIVITEGQSAKAHPITVVDPFKDADLLVKKIDKSMGKALAGAVIEIDSDTVDAAGKHRPGKKVAELTTGADGTAKLKLGVDLKAGTRYWAKETKAPEHYQLNKAPSPFTAKPGEQVAVTVEDTPVPPITPPTTPPTTPPSTPPTTPPHRPDKPKTPDTPGGALAHTGADTTAWALGGATALLLAGGGALWATRRRQKTAAEDETTEPQE
ncbi:SpaA isopeptide-forming pilin-related protein [Streptomyces nondiastaticus]|uniref:SpaA isopeptide-forming pilin-related protein n=1 Tax=Streptomyces nondiastaticus TaxID=3154512 RepID=A0ABW6TVS7_9ACTN